MQSQEMPQREEFSMPQPGEIEGALNPNPQNLSANDPNVARDPVCGMLVDKRAAQNTLAPSVNASAGGTLYFCSELCKSLFEQDPVQFGYTEL